MENMNYVSPEVKTYELLCEGVLCASGGETEEIEFLEGAW